LNKSLNKRTEFLDLGLIDYKKAWDYQETLFRRTVELKISNRNLPETDHKVTPNYIIACQHPHVYTLGKSGDRKHLLANEQELQDIQASYYHINRGGDITYHGPGQLVVYPILDLENFFTDIHQYLRTLEDAVIHVCAKYGMDAGRIKGLTGVWLGYREGETARKICAMGVKTSRWVTMHGIALNINSDLSYFSHIIPCGIEDKAVTSFKNELGKTCDFDTIKIELIDEIARLFGMKFIQSEKTCT
jgi:lipoyl(octanoyl) transferase